MQWYYNFLARRPYLMVTAIAVLCTACTIVSFTANTVPDFSDPTLGFEARGTDIGKRLTAWHNLIEQTGPSGSLVANPRDIENFQHQYAANDSKPFHKHRRNCNRNHKGCNKNRRKGKNQKRKDNAALKKKLMIMQNGDNGSSSSKTNSSEELFPGRSPSEWNGDSGVFRDYEITNDSLSSGEQVNRSEHFEYGRNTIYVDEDYHRQKVQTKKSTWRLLKSAKAPSALDDDGMRMPIDGYFCDSPAKQYAHFVVERIGPNATDTLFDLNGLKAMCQLQDQITNVPLYGEFCHREMLTSNCCRPWSVPNFAALLVNKSSCFDLTMDDVTMLQNLLVGCFEYFHDLKLSNDCNQNSRCYAPPECKRDNIVFNILQFLTDHNFIKINDSIIYLKYAMIFVPVTHTVKILPLFHDWERANLKNELVQVSAMDLGLENEVFSESLLTDCWLVALGGVFVMTCTWLYTTSIFVTVMTCVAVLFSLGLAYFIYTIIFEMTFFPYMNLLAVVVIIGIGADNVFIFTKLWNCVLTERFTKSSAVTTRSQSTVQSDHTETLQNLMALTLRHAAVSMFVSSLTTASAFYASYISSITAIKCFGVFAGTTVISNYFLMITWLPAAVSIMERLSSGKRCSKIHIQKTILMLNKSINKFCNVFETTIIAAIMRYSHLWIIVFGVVGISSGVIVLYWPGLQLPDSAHFQLLVEKHPFEVYNTKLKNEFWFEKSMSTYENFKFPLRFVWGIEPIDDGDYANPYSHENLHYDNNFNVSTKSSQVWLFQFCQHLRQQPFYELTFGLLLPNCFIENFISLMERMCIDDMDNTDRTPCCDVSKFPFEPPVFEYCLPQIISLLYATPREYFIPGVAGPKFFVKNRSSENDTISTDVPTMAIATTTTTTAVNDYRNSSSSSPKPPPMVKAVVIEFESNLSFTTDYRQVKSFVSTVESWFADELKTAPPEMQGGWFISELKFYDVQNRLSRDTLIAISLAMTISLAVLLLVTLNVLISLYAVITVSLSIFTTVAILILLGWKLNILESVTVSTAIGLTVDFSLHYGIHYRLSPNKERSASTHFALSRILGPTAMAAFTTGLAGTLMLASSVLPYIQIGMFLVIVVSVSWVYGTFFLMSLLKVGGPQYGFMQFSYPKLGKSPKSNGIKYYDRKQSQVIASEQLLTPSSSALDNAINSETHELESLTSNTFIRTISGNECPVVSTAVAANTLTPHAHVHSCQMRKGDISGGGSGSGDGNTDSRTTSHKETSIDTTTPAAAATPTTIQQANTVNTLASNYLNPSIHENLTTVDLSVT